MWARQDAVVIVVPAARQEQPAADVQADTHATATVRAVTFAATRRPTRVTTLPAAPDIRLALNQATTPGSVPMRRRAIMINS